MNKTSAIELEQIATEVLGSLNQVNNLKDQLEVIANVLIRLGFSHMSIPETEINPNNVIEVVLNDKKIHGETLLNSVVHQGLLMLMWLKTE